MEWKELFKTTSIDDKATSKEFLEHGIPLIITRLHDTNYEGFLLNAFGTSCTKKGKGVEISGLINLNGEYKGTAFASLLNMADKFEGGTISFGSNIAKELNGISISGLLNLAGVMRGVGFSLVNYSKTVKSDVLGGGVDIIQAGVFNIIDEAPQGNTGIIQIGLYNRIGNKYSSIVNFKNLKYR